jgi:hypothetical protein
LSEIGQELSKHKPYVTALDETEAYPKIFSRPRGQMPIKRLILLPREQLLQSSSW